MKKNIFIIIYLVNKKMSKKGLISRNLVGGNLTIQDRHVVNGNDMRLVSPDNVYVDIQISNYTNDPQPIQYHTTRNSDIIPKASDYYLTVARFSIPASSIPLFRFKENYYSVTVVNKDNAPGLTESRVYLTYPVLSPGNDSRQIFRVQEFLDSVNTAIRQACINVGLVVDDVIPKAFLDLDTQLQKIRFNDNSKWVGTNPLNANQDYQLWMNWPLFYYFTTMQVFYSGNLNPPDGKGYKIIVKNNYNGNYIPLPDPNNGYFMSQETPLLPLYISLQNIIVATTAIPVSAELIAIKQNPLIAASTGTGAGDSSSSATFNTITDFIPGQLADFSDNFTPYIYTPTEYRLIDLLSNAPINKLDIQVFYTDVDGNINPLDVLPGTKVNIKLGFLKKALFNNEYN